MLEVSLVWLFLYPSLADLLRHLTFANFEVSVVVHKMAGQLLFSGWNSRTYIRGDVQSGRILNGTLRDTQGQSSHQVRGSHSKTLKDVRECP